MNVLLIPEDPTYDQHILKPLFTKLFTELGASFAKVRVCQDPKLGGYGRALQSQQIVDVVEKYQGMIQVFVLCVDRDSDPHRRDALDHIESVVESKLQRSQRFFAENAWEALETWALAGLNLPNEWRWQTVRAERYVKERYFERLVEQRNLANTPDGGRKLLGKEASGRIDSIRQKCPEDFDRLAQRLQVITSAP